MLAARLSSVKRVVVGGGVAINLRLREKFAGSSAAAGVRVYFPKRGHCLDNAAMVGSLGEELFKRGERSDLLSLNAEPNLEV